MDYLKLAKKLAILAKIYQQGYLDEEEYDRVKKKVMREFNILLFVTFRVATFLKIFNPTLCPNRQISHCY